jgi:hypothetical protein
LTYIKLDDLFITDVQLYTKLSGLPVNMKNEVADFIDFIKFKSKRKSLKFKKRIPGKAKGLISMKDNFDDPIAGFNEYM